VISLCIFVSLFVSIKRLGWASFSHLRILYAHFHFKCTHGLGSLLHYTYIVILFYLVLDWLLFCCQYRFSVVLCPNCMIRWLVVCGDWLHIFFSDLNNLVQVDAMVICNSHFLQNMELGVYIFEHCGHESMYESYMSGCFLNMHTAYLLVPVKSCNCLVAVWFQNDTLNTRFRFECVCSL
jgi:hypothetical protein